MIGLRPITLLPPLTPGQAARRAAIIEQAIRARAEIVAVIDDCRRWNADQRHADDPTVDLAYLGRLVAWYDGIISQAVN